MIRIPNAADTASGLAAVDCTAGSGEGCLCMAPCVANISNVYPTVRFYILNMENSSHLARALGVTVMPRCIVLKDGKMMLDTISLEEMENLLEDLLEDLYWERRMMHQFRKRKMPVYGVMNA